MVVSRLVGGTLSLLHASKLIRHFCFGCILSCFVCARRTLIRKILLLLSFNPMRSFVFVAFLYRQPPSPDTVPVMAYHCWYCGESSDDYEFYKQHQVTASFTVEFRSGDSVTVHRASEEDGGCKYSQERLLRGNSTQFILSHLILTIDFDCPFEDCRYRYCDIDTARSHVEQCSKCPPEYSAPKAVLV